MRNLNDPQLLGEAILQYGQEHRCKLTEAADAVFADLAANGAYFGRPVEPIPVPVFEQNGRPDTDQPPPEPPHREAPRMARRHPEPDGQ